VAGGVVDGATLCGGDVVRGTERTVRRAVVGLEVRTGSGAAGGTVVVGAVEVVVEEISVVVVVDVEVVVVMATSSRTPSPGGPLGTPAMPMPSRTPGTRTAKAT
jgi:hypothetical protein